MKIRVLPPLAAAAVSVLLAGCAPGPAPGPEPTVEPTPSSTRTPEPRAIPEARLPLTCPELVPDAALTALLGALPAVEYATGDPFRDFSDVTALQAGFLDCEWRQPGGVSFGFTVTPDGEDVYAESTGGIVATPEHRFDEYGDDSVTHCAYGSCFFSLLIDGFAIEGVANRTDNLGTAEMAPLFASMLASLESTVGGALADARDPWVAPASHVPWGLCPGSATMAAVADAIGRPEAVAVGADHALSVPSQRMGVELCSLGATSYDDLFLQVTFLPSGAWAMPQLLAQPPSDGYTAPYSVATLPDGRSALVKVDTTNWFTSAIVEADGGLLHLSWRSAIPAADVTTQTAQIVAAIEGT